MVIKMTINYGEKQNKNLPKNKATKQRHGMEKKYYHDVSLLSVTVLKKCYPLSYSHTAPSCPTEPSHQVSSQQVQRVER